MSRHVTVTTLSTPYIEVDASLSYDAIVGRMIEYLQQQIESAVPDSPDLIVMPEICDQPRNFVDMFNTLPKRLDYYRARGDRVLQAVGELSRQYNCYIAYGACMMADDDATTRNAMIITGRDGTEVGRYHKNHIVPIERDMFGCLYGRDTSLITCDFGTVGCLICFDLNFDRLRHRYMSLKPDLLLFASMFHGSIMVPYWAYSCRSHMVTSVANHPSSIYLPTGTQCAHTTNYYGRVSARINLDSVLLHLNNHREKIEAIRREYGRGVGFFDPGYLGVVMLSAEDDTLSIDTIIDRYELTAVDAYFESALADRNIPGHVE